MEAKYAFFLGPVALTVFNWTEERPDGVENGCRVQLQRLRVEPGSTRQAAPAYHLEEPIWRGDFFTLRDGPPGNTDHAHHHLAWTGQQPGPRIFDPALQADPMAWFAARLDDLPGLLREAGAGDLAVELDPAEVKRLRPAILAAAADCMR